MLSYHNPPPCPPCRWNSTGLLGTAVCIDELSPSNRLPESPVCAFTGPATSWASPSRCSQAGACCRHGGIASAPPVAAACGMGCLTYALLLVPYPRPPAWPTARYDWLADRLGARQHAFGKRRQLQPAVVARHAANLVRQGLTCSASLRQAVVAGTHRAARSLVGALQRCSLRFHQLDLPLSVALQHPPLVKQFWHAL